MGGMKLLERRMRWGLAALLVGVLSAVGLVVVFLYTHPADATYRGKPGKIAYTVWDGHDSEIYTIWPGGGGKVQLTDNEQDDSGPSYSPNGERIAYSGFDWQDYDYEIYTVQADGGGDGVQLTDNEQDDYSQSYSPNGLRIAFWRHYGDYDIHTIRANGGGGEVQVTNNLYRYDVLPDYAPNGARIAFTSSLPGKSHSYGIYTIKPDGRDRRLVTDKPVFGTGPSYAPNRNRIAYVSYDGNDTEIYTIRVDGSGKKKVTNNAVEDWDPCYSPNGKRIAYQKYDEEIDGQDSEIYTIGVGGGDNRKVTNNTRDDGSPSWGSR
jgi:Tol biopolymer transport system component